MFALMSFGYIILGIVLAILGVILMLFIAKCFYPNIRFNFKCIIVCAFLFFFLGFQTTCTMGALAIKSVTNDVNITLKQSVHDWTRNYKSLKSNEGKMFFDYAVSQYPFIGKYLNYADFTNCNVTEMIDAMTDNLNEYMNWYILKRVGWCLLFIIISDFIMVKIISSPPIPSSKYSYYSQHKRNQDDF